MMYPDELADSNFEADMHEKRLRALEKKNKMSTGTVQSSYADEYNYESKREKAVDEYIKNFDEFLTDISKG